MDMIVVVSTVFAEDKRGFLSVTEEASDAGISVHGTKLVEKLASLSPGCIVLMSGLETMDRKTNSMGKASPWTTKAQFRLSSNSYPSRSTTASIKLLKDDDLLRNGKYNHHSNAADLIALSRRIIKSQHALEQPIPCQRRRLVDIQYSGQLSTVYQVRVISCEVPSPLVNNTGTYWQRKQKRLDSSKAFATLEDEGAARMVLVDCRRLTKDLTSAQQNGNLIQITNLMSSANDAGEIVLNPTLQTLILPATERRKSLSQIHTQQQSLLLVDNDTVICSTIEAIFIDDIEKILDPNDTPSAFAAALIKTGPIPTYRAATVTLGGGEVVKANSSTIHTLCGSIGARDVLACADTRRLVQDLIKCLLTDTSVQLKWTMRADSNNVRRVEIPRL